MKVKEESENVALKLSSQKTKFMASGPITSWQKKKKIKFKNLNKWDKFKEDK